MKKGERRQMTATLAGMLLCGAVFRGCQRHMVDDCNVYGNDLLYACNGSCKVCHCAAADYRRY